MRGHDHDGLRHLTEPNGGAHRTVSGAEDGGSSVIGPLLDQILDWRSAARGTCLERYGLTLQVWTTGTH